MVPDAGDVQASLFTVFAPCRFRVDAEILQLSVQMGAFHADHLGQLADAATGFVELVQKIAAPDASLKR